MAERNVHTDRTDLGSDLGFQEMEATESGGFSLNPRLIVTALIAAVLGIFIFQNTDDAQVNFLMFDVEMPIFLLILLTIVLTVVAAVMVGWMMQRRERRDRG